jgi:hypothetical protein
LCRSIRPVPCSALSPWPFQQPGATNISIKESARADCGGAGEGVVNYDVDGAAITGTARPAQAIPVYVASHIKPARPAAAFDNEGGA